MRKIEINQYFQCLEYHNNEVLFFLNNEKSDDGPAAILLQVLLNKLAVLLLGYQNK